ncbi:MULTISPECIES: Ig-like domain repeat protein [Methanobrevibacter]|uniref:Ig-like domain-containing protein n=1 Tax=Methanobrevibacter gottschalkii DSM 11977 TaxID=1122229 RepID=A0A3N5C926_9EURY|nr:MULTISPECIES: Ig-like domain repeat protein [Methanobrevibacter]OEC95255.1 hypothetical protein A9505_07645 [Methanobrevibacter sp. A27]RPF53101.1 Ig-like domain-containing protein [Methanobrevibacter gottschalkii DSM 11977]
MKLKNKILVLLLFLVLICCLGAVSAAEDINETITADSSIDDVNTVSVEDAVDETVSDDSDSDKGIVENQDVEKTTMLTDRGVNVNAATWSKLSQYAGVIGTDYIITLTGDSYATDSQIKFNNGATIIGSPNNYITTGSYTKTPFLNTNSALTITFINVTFKNMNVDYLLSLAGTNVLENCNFYNITAGTGHNAVIYNTDGTMNLTNCNVINSSAGYGVVSNYKSGTYTGVVMNVNHCTFINNSASVEPGAINNCGILNVDNSEFINNTATWWAGAIHTHYNAQTIINNSLFEGNVAGWNGGALYTYSTLKVYNSIFKRNKCHTNIGGGAIGASRWWSGNYDITIVNCTFEENENCNTNGNGGAITALNSGALNVHDSTFIANVAKNGQAISAFSQAFENITAGIPNLKVYNNTFYNHTLTTSDTVEISGNYTFENNTFINCYQTNLGTNNVFINPVTLNNNNLILKSNKEHLLMSNLSENILKNAPNVIYVDSNSDKDCDEDPNIDGHNWETAYGGIFALSSAIFNICDGGKIYLADGEYSYRTNGAITHPKNLTIIGQGANTIVDLISCGEETTYTCIFINLTVSGKDYGRNTNFINCTFIKPISISADINLNSVLKEHAVENGYANTYLINFDNCVFKDVVDDRIITLFEYGALNFTDCVFENITADSIVYRNSTGYFEDDSISFRNCTFSNCKFNGVVDSKTNFDDAIVIEDCTYDGDVALGTTEVDGHFYVNATKLKVVAVATNMSISSSQRGVVVITLRDAEGNAVSGVNVSYTVNGVNMSGVSDANGTITISDLTDEVTVSANFTGSESYLASNNTASFNFTIPKVSTKLYVSSVTTFYNAGKYLTATLKDSNGEVLANQKVTIKINGKTYNKITNAKGQATLKISTLLPKKYTATVNYAGDDTHIKSSANAKVIVKKATLKLTAKAKTFKKSLKTKKYTITLKNNVGKVMKKTKVTLKIKGKTYKAYTNSKGIATFKITKLTKKGKYNAYIKFAGSKYYNSLNKKVKITLK